MTNDDLMSRTAQITVENGEILQDRVPLGQWIDARERELAVPLDVMESGTYHPYGCGVVTAPDNSTVDFWCLFGED